MSILVRLCIRKKTRRVVLPHLGLVPITRPLLIGPGAALTTSCLVAPVMAIPASMGTWVVLKTRKLVTLPSLEVCPMLAGLLARACFNHSATRPILELIHGITPQPTLNWLLPAPPLPPPIARDATLASVAGKHSAGLAIYVDTLGGIPPPHSYAVSRLAKRGSTDMTSSVSIDARNIGSQCRRYSNCQRWHGRSMIRSGDETDKQRWCYHCCRLESED
jgi:hypothetical protein